MPPARSNQLNVRSRFARERAAAIARGTGMTVTEVVEEALRAYHPSGSGAPPDGLVRKGPILVKPAGGARISAAEVESMIESLRVGRE